MDRTPNAGTAVKLLLESDLDYLNRLIDLLHAERDALEARNVQQLQDTVTAKSALLAALDSNGRQRDRHLRQQGQEPTPGNWQRYLDGLDETQAPGIRDTWELLLGALRQCAELTEINARIVARTQRSVGHVLDLVRGQTGQGDASVYDQQGRSRQHLDNRPITSA
jgi:flagella synthesis protein FlgN